MNGDGWWWWIRGGGGQPDGTLGCPTASAVAVEAAASSCAAVAPMRVASCATSDDCYQLEQRQGG